jgi:hypothetical protein
MTFREQLNKVNELGIMICDLEIANECDSIFDFEYTEEEFEQLCGITQECYLQSEYIEARYIAYIINELINNGHTINEVLEIDVYELLDKASYYC